MKNLKKLISVIIAVIMIVGSFATVSAADYKDVESTDSFYKAIKVLSGLGIVTGMMKVTSILRAKSSVQKWLH
jgi:hypothetical protein